MPPPKMASASNAARGPGIFSPAPGVHSTRSCPAARSPLGQQAAVAAARVPDAEDPHRRASLPGFGRGRGPAAADHRAAPGGRPGGVAGRRSGADAGPGAGARPRHADRLRRAGLDRLRGLRAGAPDRDHRAGADPVRGRPLQRLQRDPAGAVDLDRPGHGRHGADGGGDRRRRRPDPRPHAARGHAARLHGGRDRRRGGVRGPARNDAAAAAGARARGRVGHQRPDRDPAHHRLHRGHPEPVVRPRRRALAGGARALDRLRRGARGRVARRAGAARRAAAVRRPVPRGLDRHGGARLRRRRHPARLRLPRRLPRGAGARHGLHARAAHDRHLPRRDGAGWPSSGCS